MLLFKFINCGSESLLFSGLSLGVHIHQSPPAVFKHAGQDAQLLCTHGQSNYRVMLWYQKSPGEDTLTLIGHGYTLFNDDSVENPFKEHFRLAGDLNGDRKNGSLSITNLKAQHSAVYFCAAREAQHFKHPSAVNQNLTSSVSSNVDFKEVAMSDTEFSLQSSSVVTEKNREV